MEVKKGYKRTGRSVLVPPESDREVATFRCTGCGKTNTDRTIEVFGECWYCGGHRMTGGSPGPLEWLLLQVYLDLPLIKLLKRIRKKGGSE